MPVLSSVVAVSPARRYVLALLCLLAATLPLAALYAQEGPPRGPAAEEPLPPTSRPAFAPGPRFGSRGGGFGGGSFGGPGMAAPAPAAPTLGEGPTCAFDATIYDVHMPVDQIGRLDAEALTRAAADAATFEKALSALGTSQPLYRAHQSIRLAGDFIMIGAQTPYVTNSQMSPRGDMINSVSYRQVGAIFTIAGKVGAPGAIELDLGIQASTLSEGNTQISPTAKAPVFRNAQMAHKGEVKASQPFVVISADATSTDPEGKAMVYITRVTLGPPHSAPATAPAKGE
jgi:hypothetical protein